MTVSRKVAPSWRGWEQQVLAQCSGKRIFSAERFCSSSSAARHARHCHAVRRNTIGLAHCRVRGERTVLLVEEEDGEGAVRDAARAHRGPVHQVHVLLGVRPDHAVVVVDEDAELLQHLDLVRVEHLRAERFKGDARRWRCDNGRVGWRRRGSRSCPARSSAADAAALRADDERDGPEPPRTAEPPAARGASSRGRFSRRGAGVGPA